MAFNSRHNSNPYETGFIVKLHKKCNRPNCKCMNSDYRHVCYGLKYWQYDRVTGKRYQKLNHLHKSLVPIVQKRLAVHKGFQLLNNLGDVAVMHIGLKYPLLQKDDLYLHAYLEFGNSRNALNWLNS